MGALYPSEGDLNRPVFMCAHFVFVVHGLVHVSTDDDPETVCLDSGTARHPFLNSKAMLATGGRSIVAIWIIIIDHTSHIPV